MLHTMLENLGDNEHVAHKSTVRVLLVSSSFPLRSGDISGIFVRRLADALSKKVMLEVMTPCGKETPVSDTGYPVHYFRYGPHSWQSLTHGPGGIPATLKHQPIFWLVVPLLLSGMLLATYRRAGHVDVIHANWSFIGLVCGLVGRLRGRPVITTLRGSDVRRLDRSVLARLTTGWVLRLSARTVTVSSAMRMALIHQFPWAEPRLLHIPNGVDECLLSIPATHSHTGPVLRIASIGSLIPRKAVRDLLLALNGIKAIFAFDVLIIGDGPELGALTELSERLDLTDRVHFLGSVSPDCIAEALTEIDVLVLTSYFEGRPNVVVEAMAAGRAIIATALPGVRELIEHEKNGLLFEPCDTALLGAHLKRLSTNVELRRQLGHAARQSIIDQGLTWSASAACYQALYQQCKDISNACAD